MDWKGLKVTVKLTIQNRQVRCIALHCSSDGDRPQGSRMPRGTDGRPCSPYHLPSPCVSTGGRLAGPLGLLHDHPRAQGAPPRPQEGPFAYPPLSPAPSRLLASRSRPLTIALSLTRTTDTGEEHQAQREPDDGRHHLHRPLHALPLHGPHAVGHGQGDPRHRQVSKLLFSSLMDEWAERESRLIGLVPSVQPSTRVCRGISRASPLCSTSHTNTTARWGARCRGRRPRRSRPRSTPATSPSPTSKARGKAAAAQRAGEVRREKLRSSSLYHTGG